MHLNSLSQAKKTSSHRRASRKSGSLIVELASGTLLTVVFVLLGLHMGIIIFGAYQNDRVCRDACRNAAQGMDATEANKLVNVVLLGYNDTDFLKAPKLSGPVVYQDYGGNPPAQTSPYVQVETTTEANMPFGVLAFFNSGILQDGKLKFSKKYTFPIVRTR